MPHIVFASPFVVYRANNLPCGEVVGCTEIKEDVRTMFVSSKLQSYKLAEDAVKYHELGHFLMHGRYEMADEEKTADEFSLWLRLKLAKAKGIKNYPNNVLYETVCPASCQQQAKNMKIIDTDK